MYNLFHTFYGKIVILKAKFIVENVDLTCVYGARMMTLIAKDISVWTKAELFWMRAAKSRRFHCDKGKVATSAQEGCCGLLNQTHVCTCVLKV